MGPCLDIGFLWCKLFRPRLWASYFGALASTPGTPEAWCRLGTDFNYFLCKLLDASALLLPFTNWGYNHFLSYLTRLLRETLKSFDYEEHYIPVKECYVLVIFHPFPRQYQVPCSPRRLVKMHNPWPGLWFSLLLLRCPAAGGKHPLIPSYVISVSWLFASEILAELLSLCIKLFLILNLLEKNCLHTFVHMYTQRSMWTRTSTHPACLGKRAASHFQSSLSWDGERLFSGLK